MSLKSQFCRFLFATAILSSPSAYAELQGDGKPCVRIANDLIARRAQAFGNAGILTAKTPYQPEIDAAVAQNGITYGWVAIFPVKDREEAQRHRQNSVLKRADGERLNHRIHGFYLLSEIDLRNVAPNNVGSTFQEASNSAELIWFDVDGVEHSVLRELIDEVFNPQTMTVSSSQTYYGEAPFFRQTAWLFPPVRAVIDYKNTVKASTYERIRQKARKRFREGYTLKTNGDFREALQITKATPRATDNRYTDKRIADTIKLYEQGLAYSMELWAPATQAAPSKLVAGIIILKVGSLVKVDTVFMTEGYSIDDVKIVDDAFSVWLHQQGIDWSDSGTIITTYSDSMKTEYIPVEEFLDRLAQLPKEIQLPDSYQYYLDFTAPKNPKQQNKKG